MQGSGLVETLGVRAVRSLPAGHSGAHAFHPGGGGGERRARKVSLGPHCLGVKGSRLPELETTWPWNPLKSPRPSGSGVGQASPSVVLGTQTRGPQILHWAGLWVTLNIAVHPRKAKYTPPGGVVPTHTAGPHPGPLRLHCSTVQQDLRWNPSPISHQQAA